MTARMFERIYKGKWDRAEIDYLALLDQWHVVARSNDVAQESVKPIKLLGENLVLWRSSANELQAWNDYCAHRGVPLSLGKCKDGKIVCPYHGWHFDSHGKCVHVPAHPEQQPPSGMAVKRFLVTERYGYIWVSLGSPSADVPRLPEWDSAEYRKVAAGPYTYAANALRCLDNFMDASHFPHVHPGVNGRGDNPDTTINYKVLDKGTELQTTAFKVVQPFADARGVELEVEYHYYCLSPTVAYSDKQTGPNQHWFTWCAMTPVDVDEATFWLTMSFNYSHDIPEEKILARQAIVFGEQDRWIVEAQRPYSMPLEVSDEMHVQSDRLGVAYRRWIKALGEKKQTELSGNQSHPKAA